MITRFHSLLVLFSGLLIHDCGCAATLSVSPETTGPTPDNLAYNLAHFYPGSNTADWWRYSRVSGARIFMSPSHFNVSAANRPGDAEVTNQASFLARKAALRADPLNTDYINWPVIEQRFNTVLSGNNEIVPQYALEQIHGRGGKVLSQMTLSEGSFPIASENDWAGKWIAWRTFYAAAFHMARYFDVERYSSHNEPNHSNSNINPEAWLMRVRLCSDAARSAIENVNALYGKSLQLRFTAPITAGSGSGPYADYGQPAVTGIQTDFLGQTAGSYRLFQIYGYQQYNASPSSFASSFLSLRNWVDADTPSGVAKLPFAITEYNVHTGATYDDLIENSDTLAKAVRMGAITSRLVKTGMDELYAFKFGMTAYSANFPVQKNGMHHVDNANLPYHTGTASRGAEAYRLFNKGFAPGRQLLSHSVSGTTSLETLASRDPASGFTHIFSVNETTGSIVLDVNVTALGLPEGHQVIIEDVSQWRRGIVRSIEQVQSGWIKPGSQPGQTVWLISIPGAPQRGTTTDNGLHRIAVSKDAMVRDGVHATTSFGSDPLAWTRNDPASVHERRAVFLQFDLPEDWKPGELQVAILALPVASASGGTDTVHAHLYGIDNHAWDESTLTWASAPNLRKGASAGNRIRHRVIDGAGESAHILGQLTAASSYAIRQVDVTDYLVRQTGRKASFLINQDPRWDWDLNVSELPASWTQLTQGDTQPDGLRVWTREAATESQPAAELILIRHLPPAVDYDTWIRTSFPETTDPDVIGREANPASDGLCNLLKFALGLRPDRPAAAETPRLQVAGDLMQYSFSANRRALGVQLRLYSAPDLIDWTPLDDITVLEDDGARALLRASASIPMAGSLFWQLRAEEGHLN